LTCTVSQDLTAPAKTWALRGRQCLETVLVFAVFALQGATPVPEVNEPYYLGKAIHYWNPHWAGGDVFLNTADTHAMFYFTFGWLALWLSPTVLAWTGRVLTWALMAWAWRRLSWAVVPQRWLAVLTAALFVAGMHWGHMAGEWVIGGVEAKGFAYVLVFLGLEAMVANRWNRAWILLGAASAYHPLVGGWATVAAGVAWLLAGNNSGRTSLRSMWPALLAGLLLSLPGLIPALLVSKGADPDTLHKAHWIYVFGRLNHHLAPSSFPAWYVYRFLGMGALFFVLDRWAPGGAARVRLRGFVAGSLAIAALGMAINMLTAVDDFLAAGLLRFYWFRLSDVAVPLGVAMVGADLVRWCSVSSAAKRLAAAVVVSLAVVHLGWCACQRCLPAIPRADRGTVDQFWAWRWACEWVAKSSIPQDARFLTPVQCSTFKWYSGRGEVANWKELPQDSQSLVRWWDTLKEIYAPEGDIPSGFRSLAELDDAQLVRLGRKYGATYAIVERRVEGPSPKRALPRVYHNRYYAIYQLGDSTEP
jgi:hypothetical protein